MKPLPNPRVPLFERDGSGSPVLTKLLGDPPGVNPALVDGDGKATPVFRQYLGTIAIAPLPHASVPLANDDGTPTREFTRLLAALP